jgi:hypothetical protein
MGTERMLACPALPGVESLGGHHAPAIASSLYIYALQPRAEMRADAASGWSPWRRRRSWVTAEGVIGGNLDQDDPDAVGVLDPHLGQAPGLRGGSRMTGTPAAASRACPARTFRTWIQIITERPAGPARCPETSSNPVPRKNTTPGSSGGRTPGRWPGRVHRGRSGGCGPGRWAAAGSGCSERPRHHSSITVSDSGAQGERALTRLCAGAVRDGRRAAPNGHSARPAVPHGTSRCRRSGGVRRRGRGGLCGVRTGWRHPSRGPRRLAARGGR